METAIALGEDQPLLLALAAFIFFVLGIVAALEAIMKTRTAQGAVAWAILLVVLPPLMVPLYWVFGRRKFIGYARAKHQSNLEIGHLAEALYQQYQTHPAVAAGPDLAPLEQLASTPFNSGNHIQLLVNGDSTFADIFAAIERAQRYVLLEFYIVRDDAVGDILKALLIRKAAEGVRVYFLYDEIGSFQLGRDYIHSLSEGGIDIHPFNSTKGFRNRFQLNFRNHRKIVVVDGDYANIGGMNIGDEYLGKHQRLSPWRDTNIAIEGPAVQAAQLAFVEDWYWATDQLPELDWTLRAHSEANAETLVLSSGPADAVDTCALYFLNLIHQAKRRLWIVSPYFVPDAGVVSALQLAALRGVDVRILLPGQADKLLIQLSSYTSIEETLQCGVQFYRYQQGFLHQKVLLMDDDYSSVGTANLDNRSFRLNFEISVFNRSRDLAQQVEAMLLEDFGNSRQLTQQEVDGWSLGRRLLSRCAYLLAPIQ